MNPIISVIIPAYNIEGYLERCLCSVIDQTYNNIEIIVVDDGSTDSTGKVADQMAERHAGKIVVIHQNNSGVNKARVAGIKAATGDWIGFVDGDDEIERDMYQRLLENAIQYSADISHCGYQTIVNGGERIHYFYNTSKVIIQNNYQGLEDLLSGEFIEPGLWNKIFKSELLKQVIAKEDIDGSIRINEDLMLNFWLFRSANVSIYEDFCPYHYTARAGSASRSAFQLCKVMDPLKVRRRILDSVEFELKPIAWRKYLVAEYVAYQAIFDKHEYRREAAEIRKSIHENWKQRKFLSPFERKKQFFILYLPYTYKLIYAIYRKFFQRVVYE